MNENESGLSAARLESDEAAGLAEHSPVAQPQAFAIQLESPDAEAPSAETILSGLQNSQVSPAEKACLVIEAEACRFTARQLTTLRPALKEFAIRFRDSSDRRDRVAVAAAIRKYVATLEPDELAEVGFLLEAGWRFAPPISVELEVAKMVVRKLTAHPASSAASASDLAARLREIADTYLNDRLLSREMYGATALNSVLGLALLRSRHFGECLPRIRALKSQWFVDHLAQRSSELIKHLTSRHSAERIEEQVSNLSELTPYLSSAI